MKKLMFIAAAALCGTVMAESIASENIVGYSYVTLKTGWQNFTPVFKSVTTEGTVDLVDLIPTKADGSEYTGKQCAGSILIQILGSGGVYGSTYTYNSNKTTPGWYLGGKTLVARGDVPLPIGQGFAINNKTGVEAAVRISGEVDLVCKNTLPKGWSIQGNSTPSPMDLVDIKPLKADGSEYTGKQCAGSILIQILGSGGKYGQTYTYNSNKTTPGWYLGGKTLVARDDVPLASGQGFAINNKTGAEAILSLKKPIEE